MQGNIIFTKISVWKLKAGSKVATRYPMATSKVVTAVTQLLNGCMIFYAGVSPANANFWKVYCG